MSAVVSKPPLPLLAQVVMDAQAFYAKNWLLATAGNLSVRAPEATAEQAFWITASGLDKSRLTPGDFLCCNSLGEKATPNDVRQPSAETLIHAAIYQRFPQVNAVYHTHSVTTTHVGLSLPPRWASLPLPQVEMLKALGVSTHEAELELLLLTNTQDMRALSKELTPLLDDALAPGFLLKGHGLYAWGRTPAQAKRHVEGLEFLLQLLALESREAGSSTGL